MPPASVSVRRRIMWFDTDASTKYHNTAPLRLMEEAEAALLDGVGLVKEVYGWLPRAHVTVDYRRPVRFWDQVEVHVEVREVGRTSITYGFEIDGEGQLSYGSYLRVAELLALQAPLSKPPAHDELLFIIVHQAFELWFREMVFELEAVRDAMFEGDAHRARHLLGRIHSIERLLIEQLEVIETMSPQDFLQFRSNLTPASGFQSAQFREIEFISGLKEPRFLDGATEPGERERLERWLEEPTLGEAFRSMLESSGLPMPECDDETGGSSGAPYLRTTLDKRFFPDLWELRSYL